MPACTRVPILFSAHTPEPLAARPVPAPKPTATEPEKTSASMVCRPVANSVRSPSASMSLSTTSARMVAIESAPERPKPSAPIRLRATEMPIEAPTPVELLAAIAADNAATVAAIFESETATMLRSPAAWTVLDSSTASVAPRIALMATAPAPLNARPDPPAETPIAAEAATDTALMLLRRTASSPPSRARLKLLPAASTMRQTSPRSSIDTDSVGRTRSHWVSSA